MNAPRVFGSCGFTGYSTAIHGGPDKAPLDTMNVRTATIPKRCFTERSIFFLPIRVCRPGQLTQPFVDEMPAGEERLNEVGRNKKTHGVRSPARTGLLRYRIRVEVK